MSRYPAKITAQHWKWEGGWCSPHLTWKLSIHPFPADQPHPRTFAFESALSENLTRGGKEIPHLKWTWLLRSLKKKKKKYSKRTFDKMRHLVHEVLFHIQDYVRVWYVFKVVWKRRCLALAWKDKTRPLLLLLSVTVKTFSIQNQGQHCAPLSYEKVTTAVFGFLKVENTVLDELVACVCVCVYVPVCQCHRLNRWPFIKTESDSIPFTVWRIHFLYRISRLNIHH